MLAPCRPRAPGFLLLGLATLGLAALAQIGTALGLGLALSVAGLGTEAAGPGVAAAGDLAAGGPGGPAVPAVSRRARSWPATGPGWGLRRCSPSSALSSGCG